MKNQFKGICFRCGKEVLPKQGFFQNRWTLPKEEQKKLGWGKWLVRCTNCVETGNKVSFGKEPPLTT